MDHRSKALKETVSKYYTRTKWRPRDLPSLAVKEVIDLSPKASHSPKSRLILQIRNDLRHCPQLMIKSLSVSLDFGSFLRAHDHHEARSKQLRPGERACQPKRTKTLYQTSLARTQHSNRSLTVSSSCKQRIHLSSSSRAEGHGIFSLM